MGLVSVRLVELRHDYHAHTVYKRPFLLGLVLDTLGKYWLRVEEQVWLESVEIGLLFHNAYRNLPLIV